MTTTSGGALTLWVGNNGSAQTYSGTLSDNGQGSSLIKVGAGTFVLAGSNTYSGTTGINGGTLAVASLGAIPSGSPITFGGGTLGFTPGFTTDYSSQIASSTGPIAINTSGQSVTFNSGLAASNSGGLTLVNGQLQLAGPNAYTGNTTISGGTLVIGGAGVLGGGNYAGTITDNAVFVVNSSSNQTFSGVISGNGALTKGGAGYLTLTSASTYTGPTSVSGGTLQLAAVSGVIGNVALSNNSSLVIANPNAQAFPFAVSGAGSLQKTSAGSLILGSPQTYTGPTVISAGTLTVSNGPSVSGFGAATSGTASQSNGTWQFNSTSNGSGYTATAVTGSTLTLTDGGSGESRSAWDLTKVTPANGFQASFTYNPNSGSADGMTFVLQSAGTGALGGGGGSYGYETSVTPSVGIMLNLYSNVSQTSYAVNGTTPNIISDSNSGFFHSGTPINVNVSYNAQTEVLSWTMTNSTGSFSDSQSGVNMQTILGSPTAYIGFTGADGGATANQQISNFTYSPAAGFNNPLPTGTALSLGGVLDLAGYNQTVGSLTGSGTVTNSVATSLNTFTAGGDSSSQTFSGVLQNGAGTLAVVKQGSGLWQLSGNNTYSGGTTISGGTVQIGNGGTTGSLGSGNIVLNNAWLSFNRSDSSLIIASALTSGTVSQDGTGTTTLTGNNTYAGGTFIDIGALQVGNGGNSGSLGTGPIVNNGILNFSRSDTALTVAGAISGSGAINQNGAGNVTLTGSNSYTGPTTINNGELYINGANATSAISVAAGALGGTGTASLATATIANNASIEAGKSGHGGLTLGGLTFDNNASVYINNISQYVSNAAINVTGNGGLSYQGGPNSVTYFLGGLAPTNTSPQIAHLIQYSGSVTDNGGFANPNLDTSAIVGYSQRTVINLVTTDPGYLDVQYYTNYPLWTGANGATWFTSPSVTATGTTNWVLGSNQTTPTNFVINDAPIFNDSASNPIVNITDPNGVYPSLVTFNNNTLSYTLTGAYGIQGSAALVKNGNASLSIYTANGYTGGTTLNAGLLNIANSAALGSAAGYVGNGSTFAINGGSIDNISGGPLTTDNYPITWNAGFTFVGSNPLNLGNGAVTLGSSSAAVKVKGSTLEIDGAIGDGGFGYGFTQSGAGMLVLTGASTYLGPTVVSGGTLSVGNGGSGASIGTTSGVSVAANAVLLFNHTDAVTFPATISGSGSVVQSGALSLLNLTNNNTYTGGTTVASGALELSFGGPAGTLAPNSTVTVNSGAFLLLNASSALGTSASSTALTVNSGGQAFVFPGYRVPLWNTVTLTGGSLTSPQGTNGDGNGNYSLGGQINATSDASGNPAAITATQVSLVGGGPVFNVTRGSAATGPDLIVSSVISSLPSGTGLTVQGNGLTQFTGASTYNGGTTVLSGTLQAGNTSVFGVGNVSVVPGALVDINGYSQTIGALNGGGVIDNIGIDNNAGVGTSPYLTIGNNGASGTFSGTIQNTYGSTTLVKAGSGMQLLNGTNTYTGGTDLQAGVLSFTSSSALALNSGSQIIFQGGTLQWAPGNTQDVSAGIAPIASGVMAGIDTNGNNVTFANSSISGTGGLTKIGAGALTLAVPNTFQGTTNITGGSLVVGDPGALQNSTVNVGPNYSLVFGSTVSNPVLGGLSGSGNVNLPTTPLTVGANNANSIYSGVLNGGNGLTKTGSGTLTLYSQQAYNGATLISAGTVKLPSIGGTLSGFGGTGVGWSLNGAPTISSNLLTLTFDTISEARSAFLKSPVAVTAPFNASYVYTDTSIGGADGVVFMLQSQSLTALGGGGGSFGYGPSAPAITPSVGIGINIYSGAAGGNGVYWLENGQVLTTLSPPKYSFFDTGDPIQVNVSYNGSSTLSATFTDLTTSTSYSASYPIGNIASIVGNTAYVGFSGGDGGAAATQTVGSFSFSNSAAAGTNNVLPTTTALSVASGGTFDLAGNNQTVGSLSGAGTVTNNNILASSTLTAGGDNSSQTFLGSLQNGNGVFGLTKVGTGSLTLTGTNVYSGPTTLSGGILAAGAAGSLSPSSAYTVSSGTLAVTAGAQAIQSLTVGSGAALNLTIGNTLAVSGSASFAGALNLSGNAFGTEELLSYLSYSGSFATSGIPYGYQLQYTPTQLDLITNGAPAFWAAAVSGNWTTGSNWVGGVAPNAAGQSATFNVPTSAAVIVTLDQPATVGTLTFGNSGGNLSTGYTISGTNTLTLNNSGSASLIYVSEGTHTIATPVSLAGNVNVSPNAGSTLTISGNISQTTPSSLTLSNAGMLILSGANTYTGGTSVTGGTLQLGDGVVNNGSVVGNIALSNKAALVFANPATQVFGGSISGNGSVTMNGPGTLQITANHSYTGPTNINAGLVQLVPPSPTSVSGFGSNAAGGTGVVDASITNGTWTFYQYTYNSGLNNTPVTNNVLDLTDGNGGGVTGNGSLRTAFYNTKVPVNTSFTTTFTYTPTNGGLNYDNGFAFVLQNDGTAAYGACGRAFGVAATDPAGGGGSGSAISPSVNLDYDIFRGTSDNNAYTGANGQTNGAVTGYNTNGGDTTNISILGGSSYTPGDPINLSVNYNASTQVLTWSGTDAGNSSLTFTETQSVNLVTATGGTSAYIGFTGADGYFASTQTISNFNFSEGIATATNLLPATTSLLLASGGTLDLDGTSQTVASLSGSGLFTNSGGTISLLTVSGTATSAFAGTLQDGASQLALVLDGSGTLILSGSNTFSGGTSVEAGTLIVGSATALADGSSLTVGQGASSLFAPAIAGPAVVAAEVSGVAAVPEPGTLALLIAAIASAAVCWRSCRRGN
jgi:autotransporter-associated beta strand protein